MLVMPEQDRGYPGRGGKHMVLSAISLIKAMFTIPSNTKGHKRERM